MEKEPILTKVESHFPPFDNEQGRFIGEAKEPILEKLEQKIHVINGMKNLMDETKFEEEPRIVEQKFRTYREKVFNQYPEVHRRMQEIAKLDKQVDNLGKQSAKLEKTKKSLSDYDEFLALAEKRTSLLEGVEGEDVRFLLAIQEGMDSLIKKFSFVKEARDDRAKLIHELEHELFPEYREKSKRKGKKEKRTLQ